MGAITGTEISNAVRILSQDNGSTKRYEDSTHLVWMNEALRAVCAKHPEESSVMQVLALGAGIWQTLPTSALRLLKPICNMGVGGATYGSAVRFTDKDALEQFNPNWQTATAAQDIEHVLYDPDLDSRRFAVYPPALVTSTVQVLYATIPTAMVALADAIPINDSYANAVQAYMMFRYFSTDTEDAANAQAAASYYELFKTEVA